VSMATPILSFLEENFAWSRRRAGFSVGAFALAIGLLHIVYYTGGFLDEWDYWAGTFGLVIVALLETILFVWVLGPTSMWQELHEGALWTIPRPYKFIMTYLTPLFLLVMMVWWTITEALPTLRMVGIAPEQHATRWASRGVMAAILVGLLLLVRTAWSRRQARGEDA
jgi:NSS family neurotransmitter:Na+ symporter